MAKKNNYGGQIVSVPRTAASEYMRKNPTTHRGLEGLNAPGNVRRAKEAEDKRIMDMTASQTSPTETKDPFSVDMRPSQSLASPTANQGKKQMGAKEVFGMNNEKWKTLQKRLLGDKATF
jgi:hypothetical protein